MLTTLLDGQAFAERHGSDPVRVVALHGWARNRNDWNSTLDGLDALAIDLPGFGTTPAPESAWSTERYADWVSTILRDLDRPVLVGHSFGGRVSIQLAAKYPELTSGLVLTGIPLYRPQASGKVNLVYRTGRALHRRGLIADSRMEKLREKYGSPDYRNAKGVMRAVLVKAVNDDYTEQIDTIAHGVEIPVRLVWGEGDTAAPTWMPEQAMAILRDRATLEVVSGSTHQLASGLEQNLRLAIDELVHPQPEVR
ncbi:alpha/beta hydrolase [Nocardioides sp. NPDC126508]